MRQPMRYALYAFGLIVAAAVGGHASPLVAWGWRSEAPPLPQRKPEKKKDPHPLVGKWLDMDRLRLIEFKQRGELVDSLAPAGGLSWMPIDLEKRKFQARRKDAKFLSSGHLRVADTSFREVYGNDLFGNSALKLSDGKEMLGAGKEKDVPRVYGFELRTPEAECKSPADLDRSSALDREIGKTPKRICLRRCDVQLKCELEGELAGQYDRVHRDSGDQDVPIFDAWVELKSGKVIVFAADERIVGLNGADSYLLAGEWGKIAPRPPRKGDEKDRAAGQAFGATWTMQVVEEGALVVRVGGSMTVGTRVALCEYRIGFAYDTATRYRKAADMDALKLSNCRVSWEEDDDYEDKREESLHDPVPRDGSLIVRVLSGERLDVSGLHEQTVVLRGMDRR